MSAAWSRRLAASWRTKLVLTLLVNTLFCLGYFTIQRWPLRQAVTLPPTWIDERVPFSPAWIWVYHSIYPLTLGAAWLSERAEDVRRYAWSILLLSVFSFAIFCVWPVGGPRPAGGADHWLYTVATTIDTPLNAFPSLHIGLIVLALLHLRRTLGYVLGPVAWCALLAWTSAVAASTLFTKQHYAIDLVAGAGLAVLCDWIVWRRPRRAAAALAQPAVTRNVLATECCRSAERVSGRAAAGPSTPP